ncbi:uncharacterized protein TNCV_4363001 [Trichonephila clavipes]|nr:uncharacterized protein TNCV_4363001 [Trichonephila clavipes]
MFQLRRSTGRGETNTLPSLRNTHLRKTSCSVKSGVLDGHWENGTWRRRSNLELFQSFKKSVIVNFIKTQRIQWAGHVVRMDEDHTTKNVFNAQPIGTRRRDRTNLRWIDGLKNFLVLRTKNWRTLAGRRLPEKSRFILGCRTTEEGRNCSLPINKMK